LEKGGGERAHVRGVIGRVTLRKPKGSGYVATYNIYSYGNQVMPSYPIRLGLLHHGALNKGC
jgi:hypothetical protein